MVDAAGAEDLLDRAAEVVPDLVEAAVEADAPAPVPSPQEALAAALAAYEQTLTTESLSWLDESRAALRNEIRRLNARGRYRVLLHGAFVQAVPPRETPQALLIQTGDRFADRWSVEGTLAITLGRFLHADVALWRQAAPDTAELQLLREHRRMRSGELHYLDHPAFGVLIRIDPVAPPQALVDMAAAAAG
ncbi:MAG: hypothetical protein HC809_03525 [Gammaproteobacteria bacterium]|nr:hypothetical protein [Gammaproteobacteria bacterium]